MTLDEHEDQLIDAIMLAIGQASRLDDGDNPTVAIHVDTVRRALIRCIGIVDRLGEAHRDPGRA